MSELWEKEEFEYSVTAALTAMYETDLFKLTRKVSPPYRVEPEELKWAKKIGPYFPARTAKCKPTRVSPLSLPQFATWAHTRILPQEENVITGYCSMLLLEKQGGEKMEEGRCRSCGAPVVWIYGATRRTMCNPEVLTVITDDGLVVKGRGSHFSTCPDANKWRRKRTNGKSDRANVEVESHGEGNHHRGRSV